MSKISDKIKYIRKEIGLSQRDFSSKIGFSQSAIASWESGKKTPSLEAMVRIFDFAKDRRIKVKRVEFFSI